MSIPGKGWILVAIPLLGQMVFLSVLWASRRHQIDAQEMAIHTKQVILRAETCHRLVVEAQRTCAATSC